MKNLKQTLLFLTMFMLGIGLKAQNVFWDAPQALARNNAQFPQTVEASNVSIALWQEKQESVSEWPSYSISLMYKTKAGEWQTRRNVLGPFTMTTRESGQIYSVALSEQGGVWISILTLEGKIDLYFASGPEAAFSVQKTIVGSGSLLAPRLFTGREGEPILFVTTGLTESFQIQSSQRDSLGNWPELSPITDSVQERVSLLPTYVHDKGVDYLVYQTLFAPNYQLYLRKRTQGAWSEPIPVSDYEEDGNAPSQYDNQRPSLAQKGPNTWVLTWERKGRGQVGQIYYSEIDSSGLALDWQRASRPGFTAGSPLWFTHLEREYLLWFDNRRDGRNTLILAEKDGLFWRDSPLVSLAGDSTFGRPLKTPEGLNIVWENLANEQNSVYLLQPDLKVSDPVLIPVNFRSAGRYRGPDFTFQIRFPNDPSGISGYNYLWTQDSTAQPEPVLRFSTGVTSRTEQLKQDGKWYLRAIVRDFAGNWSAASALEVEVDTTPPLPARMVLPRFDEEGFLVTNDLDLSWSAGSPDTALYSYRLDFLGALGQPLNFARLQIPVPSVRSAGDLRSYRATNLENGWWALSVLSIDEAGNSGEPYSFFFRLNKFRPYTVVSYVDVKQDGFGRSLISIEGRGFTAGGRINRIYFDKDGQAPWDLTLNPDSFQIDGDRKISGIVLDNAPTGIYRVVLSHPVRGLFITKPLIRIDEMGTIKYGNFKEIDQILFELQQGVFVVLDISKIYFWLILAFLLILVSFSLFKLMGIWRESLFWRAKAQGILNPQMLLGGKMKPIARKIRGLGLRIKFTISILLLTVAVITMLALTLGYFIIENSRQTLVTGLMQKTQVLMDSLVSGARNYLPTRTDNRLELNQLPAQISALEEAQFTTISGLAINEIPGFEFVWASNDPDIVKKIDTQSGYRQGESRISDELSTLWANLETDLNARATEALQEPRQRQNEIRSRILPLTPRLSDPEVRSVFDQLQDQDQELVALINTRLFALAEMASWPPFDPLALDESVRNYTFYKPILYLEPGNDKYVKGMVRLSVSIDTILSSIEAAGIRLVQITLLVALAALGLGLLGALVLATITVNPIRVLVKGVEFIRDTDDKEKLAGHEIEVKTKDELALLAETINEMTHGLVKAAAANKDLIVGKEVQKMFIPLQTDSSGRKMTTGDVETPQVLFFGYYEGAKGVSGDYFDYQKLDEDHYALIKCDVAGKGVPAALIMVEVATIFLNYFKDWNLKTHSIKLEPLVYRMNTLLEERGFKGRFAALTLGVLNAKTGNVTLINAGDTLYHIYDSQKDRFQVRELPKAPAAGVFPSDLVEMQSGFKQVTFKLLPGDTLFLYTDGVEEAKRNLYGPGYKRIWFTNPVDATTEVQEGADGNIGDEEMGPERIDALMEALYSKSTYELKKLHDPADHGPLIFDFSQCEGTARDAILAMAGMEKLFRMVAHPSAGVNDKIRMDRTIDQFLKKYFLGYDKVFRFPPVDGELPEYIYHTHLKEDDQYDDLTLLAIQKK